MPLARNGAWEAVVARHVKLLLRSPWSAASRLLVGIAVVHESRESSVDQDIQRGQTPSLTSKQMLPAHHDHCAGTKVHAHTFDMESMGRVNQDVARIFSTG